VNFQNFVNSILNGIFKFCKRYFKRVSFFHILDKLRGKAIPCEFSEFRKRYLERYFKTFNFINGIYVPDKLRGKAIPCEFSEFYTNIFSKNIHIVKYFLFYSNANLTEME
jgi:hypothetical protein